MKGVGVKGCNVKIIDRGNIMSEEESQVWATSVLDANKREKVYKVFISYIKEVMDYGAKKHGESNWMQVDGRKSSHTEMHDSMFHHLADSFAGNYIDGETKCHPLAHLATRALMRLYIEKNNIRND